VEHLRGDAYDAGDQGVSDERDDAVLFRMLAQRAVCPNGGNRRGWRVIVLRDPATRVRIRELYQLGWREYVEHVRRGLVPFAPWTPAAGPAQRSDLAAARRLRPQTSSATTWSTCRCCC